MSLNIIVAVIVVLKPYIVHFPLKMLGVGQHENVLFDFLWQKIRVRGLVETQLFFMYALSYK